jgi:hypothetical protein
MSNWSLNLRPHVATPAQDLHTWLLHLRDHLRPASQIANETGFVQPKRFCTNCQKPSQESSSACSSSSPG